MTSILTETASRRRSPSWRAASTAGPRCWGSDRCPGCGRAHETRDGDPQAIGPLRGRNRIVAAFYDGPGWVRFRQWERLFLAVPGRRPAGADGDPPAPLRAGRGVARARGRHRRRREPRVPAPSRGPSTASTSPGRSSSPAATASLGWPGGWPGPRPRACRFPMTTFDACYSIGGFTYFRRSRGGPARDAPGDAAGGAGGRRRRVPGMHRAGLGHLIGRPALDACWLRQARARRGVRRHGLAATTSTSAHSPSEVWPQAATAPDLEPPGLLSGRSGPRPLPTHDRDRRLKRVSA